MLEILSKREYYKPSVSAAVSMALDRHLSHLTCTFITIFCCSITTHKHEIYVFNKLFNCTRKRRHIGCYLNVIVLPSSSQAENGKPALLFRECGRLELCVTLCMKKKKKKKKPICIMSN